MKKLIVIGIVMMLLLTSGCAKGPKEAPASAVPGYYSCQQALEGGAQGAKDANLAEVDAMRRQEEICLTLSFVQGSRVDQPDAPAMKTLPAYSIQPMTAPSRLKVTIKAEYAEFAGQEPEAMGEYMGMITEKGEGEVVLYLQFSGRVAYKVKEDAESGTLTLCVRADDAVEQSAFHVKVPYREESAVAEEFALTPVLCEDGVSLYSLSGGFEEMEEADAVCAEINGALEAAGSDDTAEVIRLRDGEAPVYTEPVSRSMLTVLGALKTADGVVDGELVAMDARFLCRTDEGGMVMARPIAQETGEGIAFVGEELWVYNHRTGRREQLAQAQFVSVQKAALSHDGRYLAILDASNGARLMYLLDRRSGGLIFLSAEGMGDYTADFVWGGDGKLYAMCGEDSMQLMAYDPALTDGEENALTALEEREGGYGNVAWANGKVIFGSSDGAVYAVDTQTGEREQVETASGFAMSPDGSRMLLVNTVQSEESSTSTLRLREVNTGLTVQIAQGTTISGYIWAQDSSALFYLTSNKGAAEAEDYPVRLQRYEVATGVTEDMGALASNIIFPGRTKDDVILLIYQERDGAFYPITYKIDLKGGVLDEEDELIVTLD